MLVEFDVFSCSCDFHPEIVIELAKVLHLIARCKLVFDFLYLALIGLSNKNVVDIKRYKIGFVTFFFHK